jgi:hypothetical protein
LEWSISSGNSVALSSLPFLFRELKFVTCSFRDSPVTSILGTKTVSVSVILLSSLFTSAIRKPSSKLNKPWKRILSDDGWISASFVFFWEHYCIIALWCRHYEGLEIHNEKHWIRQLDNEEHFTSSVLKLHQMLFHSILCKFESYNVASSGNYSVKLGTKIRLPFWHFSMHIYIYNCYLPIFLIDSDAIQEKYNKIRTAKMKLLTNVNRRVL